MRATWTGADLSLAPCTMRMGALTDSRSAVRSWSRMSAQHRYELPPQGFELVGSALIFASSDSIWRATSGGTESSSVWRKERPGAVEKTTSAIGFTRAANMETA